MERPHTSLNKATALQALERLRKRLLNLTIRNRLLNFPHKSGNYLRVIDELPNRLYSSLLNGREMRFLSIPDPTLDELIEAGYVAVDSKTGEEHQIKKIPNALEWARHLGLTNDYEMPLPIEDATVPDKYRDEAILLPLYPGEMETRLHKLRSQAQTVLEETGTNQLFLAFGFLEWYEKPSSNQSRHGPLMLVPVQLQRGRLNKITGIYEHTIAYTGEDILPNLSLQEKLRRDFNLDLPELNEDHSPEQYLKIVSERISYTQKHWKVRRYITLALFNFSKLLMYLDLDPANWPPKRSLLEHSVISQLLGSDKAESETEVSGKSDEYAAIDDQPDVHLHYPLIYDADSSQHSALVDVIDGNNLVIIGPPGTGKSQTITNLIAAALAQGKTILFVAEKLAALEVVKRRLDSAGLGDFCLELHSHKTQKRKLLDDLNNRLKKKFREPEQLQREITHYEESKNNLRKYLKIIHKPWKQTGHTIHEILLAAVRYRQLFPNGKNLLSTDNFDETLTEEVRYRYKNRLRAISQVFREVTIQLPEHTNDLRAHPWFGVNNTQLHGFESDQVGELLECWQQSLKDLIAYQQSLKSILATDLSENFLALHTLAADLNALPPLRGDEDLNILPKLKDETLNRLIEYLDGFRKIQKRYNTLSKIFTKDLLINLDQIESFQEAANVLIQYGINPKRSIKALQEDQECVKRLIDNMQTVTKQRSVISRFYNISSSINIEDLKNLESIISLTTALPEALTSLRSTHFDNDELDEYLPILRDQLTDLRERYQQLSTIYQLKRLPTLENLQILAEKLNNPGSWHWFRSDWRTARRQLLALAKNREVQFKHLKAKLNSLLSFVQTYQSFIANPNYSRLLGDHFNHLNTDIDAIEQLRGWYKTVRNRFGSLFGPTVAIGDTILDMAPEAVKVARELKKQGLLRLITDSLNEINTLRRKYSAFKELQQDDVPFNESSSPTLQLKSIFSIYLNNCRSFLLHSQLTLEQLHQVIKYTSNLRRKIHSWQQNTVLAEFYSTPSYLQVGLHTNNQNTFQILTSTCKLAQHIVQSINTTALRQTIYQNPSIQTFQQLQQLAQELTKITDTEKQNRMAFQQRVELDLEAWQILYEPTLSALIQRNELALSHLPWFSHWIDYRRERLNIEQIGLTRLIELVENREIEPEQLTDAYSSAIYEHLANEIFQELDELSEFSGKSLNTLRKQFKSHDLSLQELQRELIAWKISQRKIPKGQKGSRAGDFTELALIKRECDKKAKHIKIRQLLERAGNAVSALKPCFMMGPMSLAQYTPPGQIEFDLVIMDEASQMRQEEALGAIGRGKQVVVVGDPKQLPPTSFFERLYSDDDDEDDPTIVEDSESILEATVPMLAVRQLRWHYRSQHESLIAFSNHHFYDDELVIFPSSYGTSGEFGIHFKRVHQGCFINRRNTEEANVIARAIEQHLLICPNESLGIVAMNTEQRDRIEQAIMQRVKDNELLEQVMERNRETSEPLFVKNLENVQGDERDVIFISCTYGPRQPGGKVPQRFGPINSSNGWRRLNVLFTRAKKQMQVFSSMEPDDIVVSATSHRGVQAFRDFLAYAKTGVIEQAAETGREPDSDFEIAVTSALSNAGFECIPQVGVAGFFIDIAVRDPGRPGRYLMGIECDGATYHSAKSVRDRDRLRQQILEQLGWNIRRIWSTDWFKNPNAELLPIIRELNELKTQTISKLQTDDQIELTSLEVTDSSITHEPISEKDEIPLSLREKLLAFDQEIIRLQYPDTSSDRRLLRPAMLEALIEFEPHTKTEFLELIPHYLRAKTDSQEGKYLQEVLDIISRYESMEPEDA